MLGYSSWLVLWNVFDLELDDSGALSDANCLQSRSWMYAWVCLLVSGVGSDDMFIWSFPPSSPLRLPPRFMFVCPVAASMRVPRIWPVLKPQEQLDALKGEPLRLSARLCLKVLVSICNCCSCSMSSLCMHGKPLSCAWWCCAVLAQSHCQVHICYRSCEGSPWPPAQWLRCSGWDHGHSELVDGGFGSLWLGAILVNGRRPTC